MADEIIRMEDIYADDIVGNINEVREARGTFESLDARLDNIDGNAPSPSTSDPAMDGTASPGSADTYSRGDHVHPTDMSRQAVIDSSHKLSSDLVDDTNNTHKFATAAQLQQITTNETNISSILDGTTIDSFGDVETALSGKQATLTTAQLAAVNSGIDSTKVAQIETNKNNISTDEAALVELVDGGSKNRLNINLDKLKQLNPGSWTNNTRTVDNTSFTYNADGTITINSVGGVAPTTNRYFLLNDTLNSALTVGEKYVLSGTTGGASNSYGIYSGTGGVWDNYNGGTEKVYNSTITSVYIFVIAGTIISNVTLKPMICTKAAWDISHAYQPYRPSYQELYERVVALEQANQ